MSGPKYLQVEEVLIVLQCTILKFDCVKRTSRSKKYKSPDKMSRFEMTLCKNFTLMSVTPTYSFSLTEMELVKTEISVCPQPKAEKKPVKSRQLGRLPKRTTVKSSTVLHNKADGSDHEESPRLSG